MTILMSILAILSGLCFAVQGPVNTALGKRTDVFEATMISFLGGTLTSLLLVFLIGKGDISSIKYAKLWQLIGGFYGAANVSVIVAAIPVLGAALALSIIMLGQLFAGVFIDAFGLLGSAKMEISIWRIIGIILVAAGIFLIYFGSSKNQSKEKSDNKKSQFIVILMLILSFLAGILGAMQSPTNASLASVVGNWEGTFISFLVGFVAMIPLSLIAGKGKLKKLTNVGIKPWMLIGGLYGVGGIFLSLFTVMKLGTALQVACGMVGQLSGGIIIDSFGLIQTPKVKINFLRLLGLLVILAGVVFVTLAAMI
ncbi:MAG: DMT family transporter [Treponema sp.]|nr:DMT family transporter [Treponema sp.]